MSGGQHHRRGHSVLVSPQPVHGGHTPTITRSQSGESILRHGTSEVIADPTLVVEVELLAILDGSAALQKAVLKHFPGTLVQRCLVHKERNIRGYLSARHWKESARLFKTLRNAQGEEDALDAANEIECFLRKRNANALASLEEAGEDLLTLFRLEVPNTLHVTLLSTNAIENSFKNLRRHIGRVARWRQETDQADRWLASGLKLAEKTFRRIKGYADIPHLIKALEEAKRKEKAAEEAA